MAKHPNTVITRGDLKGLEVASSVGGDLFGRITGNELVLGLPSEALTKMTVHTLCSVIRIAKKEGVFWFLTANIGSLLGGKETAKMKLKKILEHSPNINKKCYVTRLVFLARLSAICRMEMDFFKVGNRSRLVIFDKDLSEAVISTLNILNRECQDLYVKEEQTSKRKRPATTTSDAKIGIDLE